MTAPDPTSLVGHDLNLVSFPVQSHLSLSRNRFLLGKTHAESRVSEQPRVTVSAHGTRCGHLLLALGRFSLQEVLFFQLRTKRAWHLLESNAAKDGG